MKSAFIRRCRGPCLLWLAMFAARCLAGDALSDPAPNEHVGRSGGGRIVTPVNQILTPAGQTIDLPGLRPQALALSPDGRILVATGLTHEIIVMNPSGQILKRVPMPSEEQTASTVGSAPILPPDNVAQVSFTGLAFSSDGSRLYLASFSGSIKVFSIDQTHDVTGLFSISMPPANAPQEKADIPAYLNDYIAHTPRRRTDIPAGLAVSHDGKRLYVASSLANRLVEFDTATGAVLRLWNTGVAPYDVVLAGDKAYVSNWGGRRPDANSVVGPAGHGTFVRVDPVRHIASEGSVSVIELQPSESGPGQSSNVFEPKCEVLTGLHASALALSPNGRYVVVANAGSDTLSVIDTRTDQIVEKIWARQNPADQFGASPNALAFSPSGKEIFVCNGTQNAVAVIAFAPGKSQWKGLVPVGWYPGAIVYDARRKSFYVANIKNIGPGVVLKPGDRTRFNTHQYYGSLSLVREPGRSELAKLTRQALADMRYPRLAQASLPARSGQPPRPVPERVGEPSVFKHVVYIIKENRSYDQVLGDVKEGNGEEDLCVFGERITPNQHKMVHEFALLDNIYCCGINSSDGHEWADTGLATDYMEKSFSGLIAGLARSAPDGQLDADVDALAYSPAGFIWDDAIAHGKSLRDYGEFAITRKSWKDKSRRGSPTYQDFYHEFVNGTENISIHSDPGVESLRPYLDTNTVGWDMDVPDVFRAAQFIKELKQFEQTGDFPNLAIICLPNDHTTGAGPSPEPASYVADNDLALGRIIEAISHSLFWKDTCVLAIEDDPQNGWDHVNSYRTTAYVVSPYTKRRQVVSTQYNQTGLLRTIELILGLPPMNQMDATATPMSDCFTDTPDLTPFVSITNNIPLALMNKEPSKISDPILRKDFYISARLPLQKPDQCPEDVLNRILWHAMKGTHAPYPAWAVQATDDD